MKRYILFGLSDRIKNGGIANKEGVGLLIRLTGIV
jgi:hypothetical protein